MISLGTAWGVYCRSDRDTGVEDCTAGGPLPAYQRFVAVDDVAGYVIGLPGDVEVRERYPWGKTPAGTAMVKRVVSLYRDGRLWCDPDVGPSQWATVNNRLVALRYDWDATFNGRNGHLTVDFQPSVHATNPGWVARYTFTPTSDPTVAPVGVANEAT